MKCWVGLVGWPVADGLPTIVVTHQLQVEPRTGEVRRPDSDVLPLCYATTGRPVGYGKYIEFCTSAAISLRPTARMSHYTIYWAFCCILLHCIVCRVISIPQVKRSRLLRCLLEVWWLGRIVVASFVARSKLFYVKPGHYWDRWPSLGGYTTSVCNQAN